ncbi:MAG: CHAT domain-containing protein [Candidatus Rokubacteria bacterium]|nr:CHAT domain-containing protein [Candidatus Rokubacteria bacterium]
MTADRDAADKDVLDVRTSLLEVLVAKGEYAHAEAGLREVLAMRESLLHSTHPDLITTLTVLGKLQWRRGDYHQAERTYLRALEIAERTGAGHEESVILNDLGLVHIAAGDHNRAQSSLERSLSMKKRTGVPRHDVAVTTSNLAFVLAQKGNHKEAEALYTTALVDLAQPGGARPELANALGNLGLLHFSRGEVDKAERLLLQALRVKQDAYGASHSDLALHFFSLAAVSWSRNAFDEAILMMTRALELREITLPSVLISGSEAEKQAYMDALEDETAMVLSFHTRSRRQDDEALRLAFEIVLQRKGRILDAVSESLDALRRRLEGEDREKLAMLLAARAELAGLFLRAESEDRLPSSTRRLVLEARIESLQSQLAAKSAEVRLASRPVTLARVREAVPADAALIEFVQYRPFSLRGKREAAPRYVAYISRRSGALQWVSLGDAEPIERAVTALRKAPSSPDALESAAARTLDELVMRPVRRLIGDAKTLLLAPDGDLSLVPFGALRDEDGQPLLDRFQLVYLTSGRDLLRFQSRTRARSGSIVFADPDYGPQRPAARREEVSDESRPSPRRSTEFVPMRFGRLPGTLAEGLAVQHMTRATLLTGPDAGEAALKAVRGPEVLHLATHGFFLGDQTPVAGRSARDLVFGPAGLESAHRSTPENPLLRSGLAFAGANDLADRSEDGILTALEASGLDLEGTDLVVLSACETGVGEVRRGEGVYGLRRAFLIAGARTLVMSLWKVDDVATAALMSHFYRRLASGENKAEALRQAQVEVRREERWRHPYFWASFVFFGDATPLQDPRGP